MHRDRYSTMRMYPGFATAEEANKRYEYFLRQGRYWVECGLRSAYPDRIGLRSASGCRRDGKIERYHHSCKERGCLLVRDTPKYVIQQRGDPINYETLFKAAGEKTVRAALVVAYGVRSCIVN